MAKLINCKTCNAEISSNAKHCPKCGTKIKKPIYKKVWFWIIIIIMLVSMTNTKNEKDNNSNSLKNTNPNTTKEQEEKIEYITLTVDDLEQALDDNAASAKDTYYKKYVEFTGKLSNIDSDLKYISVSSSTKDFDFNSIHCTIKSNEQKEIIKTMKKDDEITIRGKITDVGEVLGYYVDIIEVLTQ